MKKIITYTVSLTLGIFMLSSCINLIDNSISGNGNVATEKREIGSFNAIHASAGLNVIVKFGEPSGEIEVVADENLHEYIRTELQGDVLRIKAERSIHHARSKDIYVSAGSLRDIKVSSAAQLKGENSMVTDDLAVDVSSAGKVDLDVDARDLNVDVSSSANVNLSGTARHIIASASSAGEIHADDLQVEECEADASSAGQIRLNVTGRLTAVASSAGSIRYSGDPEIKKMETSSAGSISKR